MVKRAPKPAEQRLREFKEEKGFKGVINGKSIHRMCAKCNRPTRSLAETHCPTHGGKRQERKKCQKCDNKAKHDNGTLCPSCWVKADPEARGCPECQTKPKNQSHTDGWCGHCVTKAAVAAKRDAGSVLLDLLCANEGLEEGPPRPTKTTPFSKRFVVLNHKDDQKPRVVVRSGVEWVPACAERGCPNIAQGIPGTPGTHCKGHGGGHRCPGAPGEDGCPRNNCITVHESDDNVRYIKNGVQYCCACYCVAWPDDELARNAKRFMHAKEQAVREFLEQRFAESHPKLKWVMDRAVKGTRRRPDCRPLIHLIGVESHDMVIENDENSHGFQECADERDKESATHYWLNGKTRPLFFVRFNPDAYDCIAGERVTSCWGKDNLGRPRVKPSKRAEWAKRLEKLAQIVEVYLVDYTETWAAWAEADRPKPQVHMIELFYDDVKVKRNAAAQAFEAIKAAAKKRKAAAAAGF